MSCFLPVSLRCLHSSDESLCKNLNFKQNWMECILKTIFSSSLSWSREENVYFGNFSHYWWCCIVFFTISLPHSLRFVCALIQFSFSTICWLFALAGLAFFGNYWFLYGENAAITNVKLFWMKFVVSVFADFRRAHSSSFREKLQTNNLHFEFEKLFKYFHNKREKFIWFMIDCSSNLPTP